MSSSSSSSHPQHPDPSRVWIYHERQESLLCGQHALNNLLQSHIFDAGQLAEVANELDALELTYMADNNEGGVHSKEYRARLNEGSINVDERGNFSIQVLQKCMDEYLGQEQSLPHYTPAVLKAHGYKDVTEITGFLCHKSDHWFAIRNVGGRFWNLNSTLKQPQILSHFSLGTEMQQYRSQGYTVFCVVSPNLPVGHVGDSPPAASGDGTFHNMADLLSGNSSDSGTKSSSKRKDPWQSLTGKGMRLDGKVSENRGRAGGGTVVDASIMEGLTEEEQLQLALQLSEAAAQQQEEQQMEDAKLKGEEEVEEEDQLPPEPDASAPHTCLIQFRLSNGKRRVRRFTKSDRVTVLYAYIQQEAGQSSVELRAGFPPKDLIVKKHETLEQAGLASGESIQVRLL